MRTRFIILALCATIIVAACGNPLQTSSGDDAEVLATSKSTGYPTLDYAGKILPKVNQPTTDIANGNGLFMVYYSLDHTYATGSTYAYRVQVSFIYYDEDAPAGLDSWYDNQRLEDYGSVKDIETIYLWVGWNGYVQRMYFPEIWASYENWSLPQHYTKAVTRSATTRPEIWVETWNHAMTDHNHPGGTDVAKTPGSGYSYTSGTRADAEAAYRRAGNPSDIPADM